jgi:hypothetical protein
MAIGMNNTDYTPNPVGGYNALDRLFVIGNGVDENNKSDAMVILKNGNTTINGMTTATGFKTPAGTSTQYLMADGSVSTGATGPQGPAGPTGATGATGLLPNGTAAGNTPYWDGTSWITNSGNIYNNGGNVGIGTVSPIVPLDVRASGNTGIAAFKTNLNNAWGYISIGNNTTGASGGGGLMLGYTPSNVAVIRNIYNSPMTLWSNNTERMRITESGDVGIGTTTPSEKLEVTGNMKLNGTLNNMRVGNIGTGTGNVVFGNNASNPASIGDDNTIIGNSAMSVSVGNNSVAVGAYALNVNTSGHTNGAVGWGALVNNTVGIQNNAVGWLALQSNTTGSQNTAIGNQSDVAFGNLTNATAIGAGAIVNTSNQMQLGSSSLMTVMSSGNMVVSNPTLSAINSTTTATTAQVVGGYITSTSAAVTTITLPTAAAIATQLGGAVSRGTSFEFSVDNTSGANTITLAVNTGITVPTSAVTGGSTLTVSTANKLGRFRLTFTSPTTAVLFRLF